MENSEVTSASKSRGSASSELHHPPSERAGICSTQSMEKTYDTVFLNAKAGMDGVDKKKVQKVVYEMSKGSKYFSNEQRKEAIERQRIEVMIARAGRLTRSQLAEHQKATDSKLVQLEATRDLSRVWVHVDMDAFYAAVETLVDPSLAGKPMAVGGLSMICTASYEARKFGVRAAMPGFIARKLCPELIFVKPDFKKYTEFCALTREVFREYDPNFIARSLDEAYLDITEVCRLRSMTAAEVADEMRGKVHSATGLTCSAGVGPNRLLAKVCSDINKPNGQYVLKNDRSAVVEFISALPIRKVSGIGKVTERMLREVLDVNVCSDLLTKRGQISALFSQTSTDFFLAVGLGIGATETPQQEHRKSLGHERTFSALSNEKDLFEKLDELAELLTRDLEKEDLQGRTLTLKLKTSGFELRTRAATLSCFTKSKAEIMEAASKLLKAELPLSLRLMGLRMNHFRLTGTEPAEHSQKRITSFIPKSAKAFSSPAWDDVDHSLYCLDGPEMNSGYCVDEVHELVPGSVALHKQLRHPKAAVSCADDGRSVPPKVESLVGKELGLTRMSTILGPGRKRKVKGGQQTLRTFLSPNVSADAVTSVRCKEETVENGSTVTSLEVDPSVSVRPLRSGDPIFQEEQCAGTFLDSQHRDQLPNRSRTCSPKKNESDAWLSTPSHLLIRGVEQHSRRSQGRRPKRRTDTPLEYFFARAKRRQSSIPQGILL